MNTLYLQPHGFGGNLQSLFTPENVSSTSQAVGQQILYDAIMKQINGGDVDADHPVVVFGYSQSASISSVVMSQLAEQGVPSDYVRFTLIGAPDASSVPSDLYPTDVYTHEYDPVAYFPTYFNPLSQLNAVLGFVYEHTTYLSLTPDQIASASELPTSVPDALTNYYMIPAESLPLLDPLRLIPVIGQPLYDLLEPDMRILVNLGYGGIDQPRLERCRHRAGQWPATGNHKRHHYLARSGHVPNHAHRGQPVVDRNHRDGIRRRLPRLATPDAVGGPRRFGRLPPNVHRYVNRCIRRPNAESRRLFDLRTQPVVGLGGQWHANRKVTSLDFREVLAGVVVAGSWTVNKSRYPLPVRRFR